MPGKEATQRRRGIALVWVALLGLVLIGFVGLALDTGYALLTGYQLQNAADAAALAGAQRVRMEPNEARAAAVRLAVANDAAKQPVALDFNADNLSDGEIVIGHFDRDDGTFTATLEGPNAVRVRARRTVEAHGAVSLIFGPVFGINTIDLERSATAMVGGGTGAGVIALCPDCECALRLVGGATVDVNGGAVQVNSEDDCAACGVGNSLVNAPDINVTGQSCLGDDNYEGDLDQGAPPVPDPLEYLPEPSTAGMTDLGEVRITGGETVVKPPGYYSGGITVTSGTLKCEPGGVYILDGAGLDVGGNGTLIAEGVMFFVKGTGIVNLQGGCTATITPPTSGIYDGISIFQSRTDHNESKICGGTKEEDAYKLNLQGTIYFPRNKVRLCGEVGAVGNQLIAWEIEVDGTGDVTINYDGSFPAPGNDVFLVE